MAAEPRSESHKSLQKNQALSKNQDNASKRKFYRIASKTKEGLELHFDKGEEFSKKLQIPISARGRLAHEKAMAELEEWIQEAEGLFGNASITSNLHNSSLNIQIAHDTGTVSFGTVAGVHEMKNVSMPAGYFDPKVTNKAELIAFRKTQNNIVLPNFDGSSATCSWETWWSCFRDKVHRYPEHEINIFSKMELIQKHILGIPRKEAGIDNPELMADASNYSSSIMNLHQVYGKKSMKYSDMQELIANFKPEGKQRVDYTSFLSNLLFHVQHFIAIGSHPIAAYEQGIGRIKKCIPETTRRYMIDQLATKHNEYTPAETKFLDYKSWLTDYFGEMEQEFPDASKPEEKKKEKKNENSTKEFKKKEDSSRDSRKPFFKRKEGNFKGNFFKKRENYQDKNKASSFPKKTVLIMCKLHGKPVTHSAAECRLPNEVKKKACSEMKLCFLCQHEGHVQGKCPNQKIIALISTSVGNSNNNDNQRNFGKKPYKGKNYKNKKSDKDQGEADKTKEEKEEKDTKPHPFTPNQSKQ